MKAKFLSLKVHDFLKGLIVAIFTALITFFIDSLQSGVSIDMQLLKKAGIAALVALLSYLVKNLFTNSEGKFATLEPK